MATYNTFKDLAAYLGIDPNNPTPESQKLVYDWMRQNPEYEAGTVTNKFMEGYQPPQDTPPANNRALTPEEQYAMAQADAKEHGTLTYPVKTPNAMEGDPRYQPREQSPVEQSATEQAQQIRQMPDLGKFKDTEAFNRAMGAWSPLAPVAFAGGDRSGFASGERAKSDIYTQNAAENAKILQWNKQRATDNTLADKVAAAQASGKWKQNANALGAEGGASVVASQNEAVTPDIMAQKQYQSQQMNTATQNLAEVNRNKLEANAARQNADATDYNTQYNESRDAYAHNLATANNNQTDKQKETKEEPKQEPPKPEATEKPDGKVENNTQNNEPQAAAEVNQQSQATSDATNEVSEQQQLQDIADEINGIYNTVATLKKDAQQNAPQLRELKKRYDELKPQYDELASKSKNPPPQASVPDFGMFDEKLSKVPESVLSGVNQRF